MVVPQVNPGNAYPLGATFDGAGTNFAVFSSVAEQVILCLIDDNGKETQIPLPEVDAGVWHGYLPTIRPGQRYGYRVKGPWDPSRGLRCNPHKLLVDPYSRAFDGDWDLSPSLYSHTFEDPSQMSTTDNAGHSMVSVVVSPFFDWDDDHRPGTPYKDSIIYECHVKGMTALHPEIPENLRGTYAGFGHPVMVDYFKRLGVTAVELMPVHQFMQDHRLMELGLKNYWGYNSIGFFAPHLDYAANKEPGAVVNEFKTMVREYHRAGIEVILDVVYNHTAEGNHLGPTLSFKGLDNGAYYHLAPEYPANYIDFTGCGNSLNVSHPRVIQLMLDSLRYWVSEMHVDGFRFDLAAALGREYGPVNTESAFFKAVAQDPVLQRAKLIAEPWDVGLNGYQVGNFKAPWTEWNGRYRDTVRDFWRGEPGTLGQLASRISGSSDIFAPSGRRPTASINFVTAHDGFTLNDLVSFNEKHNEANHEGNRDGDSHNRSWNCGVEGATDEPKILSLRAQQRRNFLATLLLSQGTPMLSHGDELGRTQNGNNNAYCQDNALSWVDWTDSQEKRDLLRFVQRVISIRTNQPVFRRRNFFTGGYLPIDEGAWLLPDIAWLNRAGEQMHSVDWQDPNAKSLSVFLNGAAISEPTPSGEMISGHNFLLCFNAHAEAKEFTLPDTSFGKVWTMQLDTSKANGKPLRKECLAAETVEVPAHCLVVFVSTELGKPPRLAEQRS